MAFAVYLKQHPVAAFIGITLALSLAGIFLPPAGEDSFVMVAFLLVMIPTLVAFALVGIMNGRRGVRAFSGQVFNWRVAPQWALISLAVGFIIHLGSSLLALVAGRISAVEIAPPTGMLVVVFVLALLEEIGWRGFALRRLLERHAPLAATLIIGLPWALLHFVLFLYFVPQVSPVAEFLIVLLFALPLTWIYVRSGRNVLVATVMHGALNAFAVLGAAVPPAEVLWFVAASACIVNLVIVLADRRMWFTQPPAAEIGGAALSAAQA